MTSRMRQLESRGDQVNGLRPGPFGSQETRLAPLTFEERVEGGCI